MKVRIIVWSSIVVAQAHTYFVARDVSEPRPRNIVRARDLDLISAGLADYLIPLSRRSPQGRASHQNSQSSMRPRGQERGQFPPRSPPASPPRAGRNGSGSQEQSGRIAGTTNIPRVGDEHGPNSQSTIDRALAGAAAVASRNSGPPSQIRLGLNHAFSTPLDMSHIPSAGSRNTPRSKFNGPDISWKSGTSSKGRQQSKQHDSSDSTFQTDARSSSPPNSISER